MKNKYLKYGFVLIILFASALFLGSTQSILSTASDCTVYDFNEEEAIGVPYNTALNYISNYRFYGSGIDSYLLGGSALEGSRYYILSNGFDSCHLTVNKCYKNNLRFSQYEKDYKGTVIRDDIGIMYCSVPLSYETVNGCEQTPDNLVTWYQSVTELSEQDICIDSGKYWYNDECNDIPQPTKPEPQGVYSWISGLGEWIFNIFKSIGDLI